MQLDMITINGSLFVSFKHYLALLRVWTQVNKLENTIF